MKIMITTAPWLAGNEPNLTTWTLFKKNEKKHI